MSKIAIPYKKVTETAIPQSQTTSATAAMDTNTATVPNVTAATTAATAVKPSFLSSVFSTLIMTPINWFRTLSVETKVVIVGALFVVLFLIPPIAAFLAGALADVAIAAAAAKVFLADALPVLAEVVGVGLLLLGIWEFVSKLISSAQKAEQQQSGQGAKKQKKKAKKPIVEEVVSSSPSSSHASGSAHSGGFDVAESADFPVVEEVE